MNNRHVSRRQFALLAGTSLLAGDSAQAQAGELSGRQVIERIHHWHARKPGAIVCNSRPPFFEYFTPSQQAVWSK